MLMGGSGRSWSVPTFILDGHFPDIFPLDEDPVPADGNPHPEHGEVGNINIHINQAWQHELAGAAQAVQLDFGINNEQ